MDEKEVNADYWRTHTTHPWQDAISHVSKKFAEHIDNELIKKYLNNRSVERGRE